MRWFVYSIIRRDKNENETRKTVFSERPKYYMGRSLWSKGKLLQGKRHRMGHKNKQGNRKNQLR